MGTASAKSDANLNHFILVSICMAVKNGAQFVREQIDSILPQLRVGDELIISDDQSTDDTVSIIMSYTDDRIKLCFNSRSGIISNFENCLSVCKGEFIFLCDQDDRWTDNKVQSMLAHLKQYDLVVSDCVIVDSRHTHTNQSFFELNRSGEGFFRNLLRNSYMGCCMAFNRKVLQKALPFPAKIPMHDLWIGLIAEVYFNVIFIPDQLVFHRRHLTNASPTSTPSPYSLIQKLGFRYKLVKHLIQLSYA